MDTPNHAMLRRKTLKIKSLNPKYLNRYKLGRSENTLHKDRCEGRLVSKGLFRLVCTIFRSFNQPIKTTQAIQNLFLLFQFLGHLFLFLLFLCFYSLHQNTLSVTIHFWFVSVDAKDFGNVILVDFEGKDYPHLAKRLQQD
ncbi:MAG TPA: hypothetical protein PKA00_00880 [Saprospiraceae bacterium]|nr:hypothetical protein [Saprospiraceae bacterium]HMQ81420.1 hypothetical protein [Saprospiraceae bacterium]